MKSRCKMLLAAVMALAAPAAAGETAGSGTAKLLAEDWFDCAAFFSIVSAAMKQNGQAAAAKTYGAYSFIANGEGVDAAREAGGGGSALEDLQKSFSAGHLKPRIKAQMAEMEKDGDAYFDRYSGRCLKPTEAAVARLEAERKERESAKGK